MLANGLIYLLNGGGLILYQAKCIFQQGYANMFKYLIVIGLICDFLGVLFWNYEVQIPKRGVIGKILNWYIRRKSRSKNKNQIPRASTFGYQNEIIHESRFKLGLALLAIGFILQIIGTVGTLWLN